MDEVSRMQDGGVQQTGDGEPRPGDGADASPGAGAPAGDDPSAELVLDALRNVYDPELGINIVDLGLVYDVDVSDGVVRIEYTLTTMGCPIGPLIEEQMHALLGQVAGIKGVDAQLVLRPPWSPDMMSEEAKAALGYF